MQIRTYVDCRTMLRVSRYIGLCVILLVTPAVAVPAGGKEPEASTARCLADGRGYFRARISGSINAELDWRNSGMQCSGGIRPGGGARATFSHAFGKPGEQLLFVFGLPSLQEGQPGRNLPVNLTVILQGEGKFFGTVGDDKCTADELQQEVIVGVPHRDRSYRVIVRGFCMQPAPAVSGKGAVLLTRFDFAGRIDFSEEDASDEPKTAIGSP
jgi:hypothetical protein